MCAWKKAWFETPWRSLLLHCDDASRWQRWLCTPSVNSFNTAVRLSIKLSFRFQYLIRNLFWVFCGVIVGIKQEASNRRASNITVMGVYTDNRVTSLGRDYCSSMPWNIMPTKTWIFWHVLVSPHGRSNVSYTNLIIWKKKYPTSDLYLGVVINGKYMYFGRVDHCNWTIIESFGNSNRDVHE